MTKLRHKIQHALDEGRMMVLGIQVLIGVDLRSVFEPGFPSLPMAAQYMKLAALFLLCLSFALIVTPDAEHQIVARGNDTTAFHRFATAFADVTPLPFAIALGLDFAVAGWQLHGGIAALVVGVVAGVVALTMWYGIELPRRAEREENVEGENEPTPIHDKIRQVLTESRVILPGAQATLGFQLIAMLTSGFGKVPPALRWLHFASLSLVALAIILLITPAAWHRLVERGEETEEFHSLAAAFIVAALAPLAAGLTLDFYLVAWLISKSVVFSAIATSIMGAMFVGLWFVLALIRRHADVERRETAGGPQRPAFET